MKERKGVALPTNVDYYSGFAYEMLGIPRDLYTPLFVCSRMVGWVAHNIENKLYDGRIMRPATKYVGDNKEYTAMEERQRWQTQLQYLKAMESDRRSQICVLRILDAAGADLNYEVFNVGAAEYEAHGELIPKEGYASMERPTFY